MKNDTNNAEISTKEQAMLVETTRIIGTDTVYFSAWESVTAHGENSHGTYKTSPMGNGADYTWYGRVGTRRLPADFNALPAFSEERKAAVGAWHAAQYDEAYAAIVKHPDFPAQPKHEHRSMGEISCQIPAE